LHSPPLSGNLCRLRISAEKARYLLAASAGLLLALSFPKPSIAGLAWIAPGMLLFAASVTATKSIFKIGFVGGFAYYLAALYWLLCIPVTFLPILGWIALSAYLAVYTAGWAWLCWRFAPAAASQLLKTRWTQRVLWTLQCAALWVTSEMVIGRFLSGFPWDFLGVSQYRMVPLIQIAEFTGVYGVSFLIIWFSVSVAVTFLALTQNPASRNRWGREIILPFLTILLVTFVGFQKAHWQPRPEDTVQVALIQPSIPQSLIWDEKENATRFKQLLQLSETALTNKPDILIWPEASVPNMLRHDKDTADAVRDLAMRHHVWILLGSDDAELRPGSESEKDVDYFNSAFAVSPEGQLAGMYRKRRLVIFGEYVPFVKWLPFLKVLSPAGEGGFTPGDKPVQFYLPSIGVTTAVLICFEDTFPHIAREYVSRTTDFLVNLTNNGWFGESAAQWQHAATSVFRAVENRIPLVRCANNGLTCWVDATGVMHETYFPDSKDVYKAGYKIAQVPVLTRGERRKPTFYTRYGDVFGWSCCGITGLRLAALSYAAKRRKREPASTM
jgi:apolipoprotein N-acyltransferase